MVPATFHAVQDFPCAQSVLDLRQPRSLLYRDMRSFYPSIRLVAPFAAFGLLVAAAPAQLTSMPEPKGPEMETTRQEAKTERKQPGFFHRPSKKSPDEQLAYAAELRERGSLRRAANEYLAFVHQWHGNTNAPAAQFKAAAIIMERGKYERAFEEFQYLFLFFAGRFPYEEALDAQFKIANSILEDRHMAFFGLKGFTDPQPALPLFQQIARNAPYWKRAPEVQYRIGWILEETGNDADAVDAYAAVSQRYPASSFAGDAAYQRALCLRRISRSCPRDEAQCRDALSALASFLRDHPSHPGRPTAEKYRDELTEHLATMYYDRAVFYDRIARRPKSAVIAYRDFLQKFPLSSRANSVTERIAQLAALAEKMPGKKPQ